MSSRVLQYFSLNYRNMSNLQTILGIFGSLALALSALALWQVRSLNKMKSEFFAGRKGADLEHIIEAIKAENESLRQDQSALGIALHELKTDQNFALQKFGVVRFNPFNDSGGNFSFCIALLNGHNTGLVITSMHGRQQNRVYTKKITEGRSEAELTEEEQKAIKQANDKIKI